MHLRRQRSVGLSIEFGQPKASTIFLRPHSQVTLIDVMPKARILPRVIAGPVYESRITHYSATRDFPSAALWPRARAATCVCPGARARAGGVKSGDVVVVGALAGIAAYDAAAGAEVETQLEGVFDLPKGNEAIGAGAKVSLKTDKTVGTSGTTLLGAAILSAGADAATVRVRLIPGMA